MENAGKGVKVDRFGGEGTGAKLTVPLPWKVGETVACFVKAHREGDRSCYTGWIKQSPTSDWRCLGTLKTRARGVLLTSLYSFIEDFRRDVCSAGQNRQASFSNGWVCYLFLIFQGWRQWIFQDYYFLTVGEESRITFRLVSPFHS